MRNGRMGRILLACVSVALAVGAFQSAAAAAAEPPVLLGVFGPDGPEGSSFEKVRSVALDIQTGTVFVLDSEAGALYKFEADGTPLDWGGNAGYISGNRIDGLAPFVENNESQVAVDSTNHIVYVTEMNAIRAFHQDGEAAVFTAGPGVGTNELPISGRLVGIAVDANGDVYANSYQGGTVSVFAATGEAITSFSVPAESGNLGLAPGGAVYVVSSHSGFEGGGVYKFVPDQFPTTPSTTYSAGSTLVPSGFNYTYGVGVDPLNGDVYVLETDAQTSWIERYDTSGTRVGSIAKIDTEGEIPGIAQGVSVVGTGEALRLYVGNPTAGNVEVFGTPPPDKPAVEYTSVSALTSSSATLHARINPNGLETSYQFEYGPAECALGGCTKVPLFPENLGATGHKGVKVSQVVTGLQSSTTYHYRIVAVNSIDQTMGLDRFFSTQGIAAGPQNADLRIWELVSPPEKAGGTPGRPLYSLIQASPSGEGLVYAATGSLTSDPLGNRAPEGSSILATRGADGRWSSADLSPVHTEPAALKPSTEYKMFSPNLATALMEPRDNTKLSPETSEHTPYLRTEGEPPEFRPIATSAPPNANVDSGVPFGGAFTSGEPFDVSSAGATESLDHVVVWSKAPLLEDYPGAEGLYQWSSGDLSPVSVLPESEGGTLVPGMLGSGTGSVRHAISEDGNRVFWSSGPGNTSLPHYKEGTNAGGGDIGLTGLFVRDVEQKETFRLDVPQLGASGEGLARPVFQGASEDGTVVFFTDSQQLTSDASPDPNNRDLYRCQLGATISGEACTSLEDISAPLSSAENGDAYDLAPAISSNGTRVYFVASGVLDDALGPRGEAAVEGQPNLYLWEEGAGVRFLALLSSADHLDWGIKNFGATNGQVSRLAAYSTADGRYFTFMSERALTGYENRNPASEELMQQVFLYDAVANRIDCASCDPFGSTPVGRRVPSFGVLAMDPNGFWAGRVTANVLPESSMNNLVQEYSFHQPRAVLDSGRVYFESVDALLPGDSNGQWDVYQWEPLSIGDCTPSTEGTRATRSGNGCLSLISSGTATGETAFLEASVSGEDVFFLTRDRLSVLDTDTANDVYDARVNGVEAILPSITECAGESCQPSSEAPKDPTAASEQFRGPGNVHARKCPKGKRRVRRHGKTRCVPKRHRLRHGKHQRHANASRGARG